jgi:hypothetical protein
MAYLAGFGGFIVGVIVGAIAGIIAYWYFAIHRGKVPTIPADLPKINVTK